MKKNIAIVLDYVYSAVPAGDLVSTFRFADLLKKRGNKIIFIVALTPRNDEIDYHNNIKTYGFRAIKILRKDAVFFAFPTVREIKNLIKKEKIDVLHIMTPTPASLISMKAAREMKIPIVAHSHVQPENITLKLFKKPDIKLLNHIIYGYLTSVYRKADVLLCPSRFAEKVITKYHKKMKTAVVSNGVNLKEFKWKNPSSLLKKYKIPKEDKKILFVGRLYPEKNVETLIRAMQRIVEEINNTHLMIIGSGRLEKSLKKKVNKMHLSEKVTFLGRVSNNDLLKAYSACDLFVLPSFIELEGMVVLEAMAMGKPVIVSNSKDTAAQYLLKDNGFLFDTKNPRDLANKALKILKDNSLRKKMEKASLKQIKNFDIHKSVDIIESVYDSLIKKKH
jgi:glycosyltransferase involved in cell wall biosynthesis